MSVWYAIPSKRHPNEAQPLFDKWSALGFKTAAFRDLGDAPLKVDLSLGGHYQGYPHAVNMLCRTILCGDPTATIIVTGGDDYLPDPKINLPLVEAQFIEHFHGTFGVMQPTGDRYMVDRNTHTCASERVCDAPWMGRSFCERMYNGNGPICEEYYHFFEDEELHEVAKMLGVLWHRPDIYQYHAHWGRERKERPAFLNKAKLNWDAAHAIFKRRKEAKFPGHQPLGVV